MFEEAGHGLAKLGVKVGTPELDLAGDDGAQGRHGEIQRRRRRLPVQEEQDRLLPRRRPHRRAGQGRGHRRRWREADASRRRRSRSPPARNSTPLPGVAIDEERIVTSTGSLELKSVPKRLLVVGAGVIGLEIGSVWRRLGSEVTVVEFLDRILPGFDGEVAKQSQRIFQKQGFQFRLGSKVTGVAQRRRTALKVSVAPAKGEGAGGDARRRCRARRDRPPPLHRGPRAEGGRRRARRARPRQDRRAFQDERRRHLCDRRRDRRADARAQGARTRAWRWPKSSPARPGT